MLLLALIAAVVVALDILAVALCRAAALGDRAVARVHIRPDATDLDPRPARSVPRPRDRDPGRA
jgi:hypothetical protein